MFGFWLFAALATAGDIYIDSATPVLVRLEGELVRKDPATRIVIPDLSPSTYRVEITNLFGNTLAFRDVQITWDNDVNLEYADGYLDEVKPAAEVVYAGKNKLPLIPHDDFARLERKLIKGSTNKKLKRVERALAGWGLTMAQTDDLLSAFHKREDRITALYAIVDHITEPEKYNVLMHHFPVKSDRDKVYELFEAVLAAQGYREDDEDEDDW